MLQRTSISNILFTFIMVYTYDYEGQELFWKPLYSCSLMIEVLVIES